ncbi:hypothetical protein Tco_0624926 [Tanacetum coccineum]|uniref:Uncharacterized protein n=1 Tax=Tanacetum coccineum TaxID=301880 RepID=A0ABQ4WFB6_9ASTR
MGLKRRYFKDYYSEDQYAISIKEDTAYLYLHSPKTTKDTRPIRRIQERQYAIFKLYGNKIFWKISNVVPTPRNSNTSMDDPNITMEEYIRLEEEKAQNHDVHDLRSVETEFPPIAFNDQISSEETLSCEPTVSSLNDEIDFRISFDKNSFSYKIIFTNDLKTDSENDNEKVNIPSFLPPEPTTSYFNDLDFLNDFENEFTAFVYNEALTSKLDFLTEPTVSPQHIDEFNLKDETSLSECDKEEQNVLYFNDLFPFNAIYPDELKSDTDNDNDKIDI